jgi:hypothetical protein
MSAYLEAIELSERHIGRYYGIFQTLLVANFAGDCQNNFLDFELLEVARVTALRARQPIKYSKACGS